MIYLSLGSNQGNRLAYLRKAVTELEKHGFTMLEESIVLETKALLPADAPESWNIPYLNMIVAGLTTKSPIELLSDLKAIEVLCGRDQLRTKWAPRPIDLDILLWDAHNLELPDLKVPHPELLLRPFLIHLLAMMNVQYRWQEADSNYYGMNFAQIAHQNVRVEECFLRSLVLNPKLVAIVNITPDSFSDGGLYFDPQIATQKILALSEEGAYTIEIGAQSTRPNAIMVGAEEEWRRLQPVLQNIKQLQESGYELTISIDSFLPEVIHRTIIEYDIAWINDQKCELDDNTLKFIADHGCNIVVMHSLSIPPDKNNCIDFNIPPIDTILLWTEKVIARLIACGFARQQIILDPGIGFGKSIYQNLMLFRATQKLKELECQIFVGHSRKSYMTSFCKAQAVDRDIETLAVSQELSQLGVDYLRVHDIEKHQRFFVARKAVFCT
ncbi:dihydropteroate synthase [Candidatus Trichorickettsia mobilis]|uniref:dihydropteroate synthase n=1 Tax=Candidatus Trichorickettsia mobilis TaxID=1346319 RepID=UPI00292E7B67|nr:dihydropteroate synthase [Candidatus Trichorickettsia mobilis]